MSRSPAFQGWAATLHVSAPPLCVASSNDRERVVGAVEGDEVYGVSRQRTRRGSGSIVTAPSSHLRLVIVALAPPSGERRLASCTPFVPSAPTAAPMATGSKNASCSVPAGAVTVISITQ